MPAPRAAGPAFFFASCNRKSAFDIRQLRCGSRARDYIGVLLVRGHSSVGRAPALQAGSQGFESPCLQSLQGVEATSTNREHFRITASSAISNRLLGVRSSKNIFELSSAASCGSLADPLAPFDFRFA